jgi:hypothetical protein
MLTDYYYKYVKYKNKYQNFAGGGQSLRHTYTELKKQKCCKKPYDVCYREYESSFKMCKPHKPRLHCVTGRALANHIQEAHLPGADYSNVITDINTGERGWVGLCCPNKDCETSCPGDKCGLAQNQYDLRYYGKILDKTNKGRRDLITNMVIDKSKRQLQRQHKSEDRLLVKLLIGNDIDDIHFTNTIKSLRDQKTFDRVVANATKRDRQHMHQRISRLNL